MNQSNTRTASRIKNLLLVMLCAVGILSPLFVFPVDSLSCVPLAIYASWISLTCLFLLPGRIRRCRKNYEAPQPWPADSEREKRWRTAQTGCFVSAMLFLLGSILFARHWHPGHLNWQMTIASPGYMFLVWGGIIREYIRTHTQGTYPLVTKQARLALSGSEARNLK